MDRSRDSVGGVDKGKKTTGNHCDNRESLWLQYHAFCNRLKMLKNDWIYAYAHAPKIIFHSFIYSCSFDLQQSPQVVKI